MEQLNKVELVGTVGSVHLQKLNDEKSFPFSVATTVTYGTTGAGTSVCETTWHSVRFFTGKDCRDFSNLSKGARVKVLGRLRNYRYTSADGSDRFVTEVVASSVEVIDDTNLPPQNLKRSCCAEQ